MVDLGFVRFKMLSTEVREVCFRVTWWVFVSSLCVFSVSLMFVVVELDSVCKFVLTGLLFIVLSFCFFASIAVFRSSIGMSYVY